MPDKTVHVIDDDDAMRDSLAFLLDIQGYAPRLYASATAFLDAGPQSLAGCVLTDIRMPEMTGLDLVKKLKADGVAMPVVVMTGHGDVPLAVEAMKAGVVDFIEKPFSDGALLSAIQTALDQAGQSPEKSRAAAHDRIAQLSPREREVLTGVAAGKANKIIAYELDISPRTVEVYRANLMTKLGARNISEVMRIALAAGL
jgi:two-component system response regulator FixJ